MTLSSTSPPRSKHDVAPIALLIAAVLASVTTASKHALLTNAISWLSLCLLASWRGGEHATFWSATRSQGLGFTGGGLFALAQLCERAVDAKTIWWAKALLPLLLYTISKGAIFDDTNDSHSVSPPSSPQKPTPTARTSGSLTLLLVLTASGLVAVYAHVGSISVIALGLSYAVLQVLAFRVLECAYAQAQLQREQGQGIVYSASGLLTQPARSSNSAQDKWLSLLRDVSAAGATFTGAAALILERLPSGGLAYYGIVGQAMGEHWVFGQAVLSVVIALGTVLLHMVLFGALLLMIQQQGAFPTAFVPLSAAVISQLLVGFSLSRLWFATLCATAVFSFLDERDTFSCGTRMRLRVGRLLTVTAVVSFVFLTVYYLRQPLRPVPLVSSDPEPAPGLGTAPPASPLHPLQPTDNQTHPIRGLAQDAQKAWASKLQSQSQTLEAAVIEYKRRYQIPPPPHFNKWYEFAKRKNVQLIDEYDSIYQSLLPFWALSPATIRARAREAIGFGDNMLMGLMIRDGKAVHVAGGPEWLQQAAVGMMESFFEYLPDMDLAFNIHDEPRVVVPHDELSRMVDIAMRTNIPAAAVQPTPKNAFSSRPKDVTAGLRLPEAKTTRFNVFAHQPVWLPSRLSCSPDSPARAMEESTALDNFTAYALGDLGFVYNQTAFSDVCNSPSFARSHGFFERPNAFNVVHDLFPIFSQSKMSSFQDILYPSPWYWYGKVAYKESKDMDWSKKHNSLWWRGSTTGGFSRNGGWKRQHRQQFVRKVNGLDTAKVLKNSNAGATDDKPTNEWVVKDVQRQEFNQLIDVHFSHIGQCDPGDCDAQREFFKVVDPADQQDAWKYKYLLDIDGNAFSGRFYAFLMSHSLVFKMSVFREWHQEWIQPWVHYIPFSLRAEEALEAVRYFDAEEEGKAMAMTIAESGRNWAQKALRNSDFEVWMFRLMLEYGRVIDDNRASIGYSGT